MVFIVLIGLLGLVGFGCLGLARLIENKRVEVHGRVMTAEKPDELFTDAAGNFVGYRFADQTIIYGARSWTMTLPLAAISGVEVRKNGVTVTRTNRGSQLAGAAIGGLAFGLPGAMVGGLSGSSTASERLKAVSLFYVLDNQEQPVHEVWFGAWPGNGQPEQSLLVASKLQTMERFRAHALNALRRTQ